MSKPLQCIVGDHEWGLNESSIGLRIKYCHKCGCLVVSKYETGDNWKEEYHYPEAMK